MKQRMLWAAAILVAGASIALAQSYSNTSSVADGAGGRAAGGPYVNISAAAQPGGIAAGSADGFLNYAGFLGTFSLQPEVDVDGDGLGNEVDGDNDDDGLADLAELTGDGFVPTTPTDPNDADGDMDGMSDGGEAACGSDPWDGTMLMRLTDIVRGPGRDDATVAWQARDGWTYKVYCTEGLPGASTDTYLGDVTAADPGASPPWYVTEATYEHVSAGVTDARVYYITVEP